MHVEDHGMGVQNTVMDVGYDQVCIYGELGLRVSKLLALTMQ